MDSEKQPGPIIRAALYDRSIRRKDSVKKSVKIGLILVVLAVASAAVYRVMTKEQPGMAPEERFH